MKKLLALVLILTMTVLIMSVSFAEEAKGTVVVSGNATVSLVADTATLWIGARTTARSVKDAQRSNADIMEMVIAAMMSKGIAKEDIITSNFNVYPNNDSSVISSIINSYTVSNMLYVTVRDLSILGSLIDVATVAGANDVYGISFQSSKSTEAYEKALSLAVKDAQKKAGILAAAAEKELGDLVKITSGNTYNGVYGLSNNFDMIGASEKGTVIVSGDVSVSADVTLEYQIK